MSIRHRKRDGEPPLLIGYVEKDDETATYTIAPDDAVGYDLMSQWITAPATLVESLEEMQ